MNVWLEDDGLNESQPAGSIPDFDADLLTVEDLGGETHVEADSRPASTRCTDAR